jgi:hypothetical protein
LLEVDNIYGRINKRTRRILVQEHLPEEWRVWKEELEEAWRAIPKPFRNEHSVIRTLQCRLYGRLHGMGLPTVADYMPPRIQDRPVDLISLKDDGGILYAVCFDRLVTLAAVKCLTSFESVHKLIFTIGALEKKVKESRFFLKPEVRHIHLKPFEKEA